MTQESRNVMGRIAAVFKASVREFEVVIVQRSRVFGIDSFVGFDNSANWCFSIFERNQVLHKAFPEPVDMSSLGGGMGLLSLAGVGRC